jgi:hypothetical protein
MIHAVPLGAFRGTVFALPREFAAGSEKSSISQSGLVTGDRHGAP